MTDEQAEMVRGWRGRLPSEAVNRMLHMAQISNLLTALGETPHIKRPTFPLRTSDAPSWTTFTLEAFSQQTIERLARYERPGTVISDLYKQIALGLRHLPTEELFIGPPEAQANSRFLNLGAQLLPVVDQASALTVLAMLAGTNEEATAAQPLTASKTALGADCGTSFLYIRASLFSRLACTWLRNWNRLKRVYLLLNSYFHPVALSERCLREPLFIMYGRSCDAEKP